MKNKSGTRRFRFSSILVIAALLLAMLLSITTGLTANAASPQVMNSYNGKKVVGYFVEWGIYGRNYTVKNLVTTGSADKLTNLIYAFGTVTTTNTASCLLADPWADYMKPFDAASSVSGSADVTTTGSLLGNFHQLWELKQKYPNLKIDISLGGWTGSANFSAAAATDASRKALVTSCVDMFLKGNFAPGISYPGIFDGIDIDWEYPAAAGSTNNFSPADTQNFTSLMWEFRNQMDAYAKTTGKHYELSAATSAGSPKFDLIELGKLGKIVDYFNLLTYDLHGPWDATTNHAAALYPNPNDPALSSQFTGDQAVKNYETAGVPASKIVLGIPFYGHGWTGVPATNNGLYQPNTGAAKGSWENGSEDYKVLKGYAAKYGETYDPVAQAYTIYIPNTVTTTKGLGDFWSYDNAATVANKTKYAMKNGLAGVGFWEMDADDGTLISSVHDTLLSNLPGLPKTGSGGTAQPESNNNWLYGVLAMIVALLSAAVVVRRYASHKA